MIRSFKPTDIDAVMNIWIDGNIQAHHFIPSAYWKENFQSVQEQIPSAQVTVWEEGGQVLGFVGVVQGYIAGIFVKPQAQSRGIGRQLLRHIKQQNSRLTLQVYEQNSRAAAFYRREGFAVKQIQKDDATGETELVMQWEK